MSNQGRTTGRAIAATVSAALAATLLTVSGPVMAQDDASADPVSIAFIGESSSSDAIWSFAVENMRDEAAALGADFVDRFAEGDFAEQSRFIDQEVARGVDAIIAPFFDPQATNDAVRRALAEGVAVYALLGVPGLEPDELEQIGINEASWQEYGRVLADLTLPQVEDGAQILWPAEVPGATYITGAVEGFEEAAAEAGMAVEITVLDASSDPTTSASRQLAYLVANPETDAVVTTGSIAIGAATTAMRQGDLEPGSLALAGFVTNEQGYRGIKDGYMEQGIWPDLDKDSRQAVLDVVAMVTEDADPPNRAQQWVIVDAMNVDEVVPEAIRG